MITYSSSSVLSWLVPSNPTTCTLPLPFANGLPLSSLAGCEFEGSSWLIEGLAFSDLTRTGAAGVSSCSFFFFSARDIMRQVMFSILCAWGRFALVRANIFQTWVARGSCLASFSGSVSVDGKGMD